SAAGALGAAIILGSILSVAMSNRTSTASLQASPGRADAALPSGAWPVARRSSSSMQVGRRQSADLPGDGPRRSQRPRAHCMENDLYRDGG
ncbi:MAG: hypothetical protein E5V74_22185, partial [Mesorhizobium sp.]